MEVGRHVKGGVIMADYSGQDLYLSMQEQVNRLNAALKALSSRGRVRAETERRYRVALNQEILKERDKGTPVTIISDVCRGNRAIAQARFERDVADIQYRSALEAINVYKLTIRVLGEQIEREYHG